MVATGVDVHGVLDEHSPLETQLQVTLNVIPAYTWYTNPSGRLTFVNKRQADYLGLPKEHPLRSEMDTGAAWDSHLTYLHPDDQEHTRRIRRRGRAPTTAPTPETRHPSRVTERRRSTQVQELSSRVIGSPLHVGLPDRQHLDCVWGGAIEGVRRRASAVISTLIRK